MVRRNNPHTPPSTSSISLNPKSYILYDNAPPTQSDSLTRIKKCREAEASFKRYYPNLVWVYEVLIETRLKAIVGARNAFLVEAVPFLYRAVAPHFVLPLVEHFYQTNYWKFNDSLEQHLIEARSLLLGAAESYLAELSEGEKELYVLLGERHQNLFRICRDLALRNENGSQTFYVPLTKFGNRLGMDGKQVDRDIDRLIDYGLLELVDKGSQWKEGERPRAGTYRYVGLG